jgi:hypothetical protein
LECVHEFLMPNSKFELSCVVGIVIAQRQRTQGKTQMAQTVEISLRIPSLRIRREGKDSPETIANSDVRFSKRLELDAIPKPGEVLKMAVSSGATFECDVVRSEWHHEKNMFVVACRYSKRSISPDDYQALIDSTDWQAKALL